MVGFFGFLLGVFIIFIFVMWLWLLITVIGDLFKRDDIGGFAKLIWLLFLVFLPYLGVFLYLLTQSSGMAERSRARMIEARKDMRNFVGHSTADELIKLDQLKAAGSLSDAEYATLRSRALG